MGTIAVFGGSFNPFHNGHAHILQYVFKHTTYKRILLACNNKNPLKKTRILDNKILPSAKQRMEMVALGVKDIPYASLYAGEIERGGNSYTIDTIIDIYQKNIFKLKKPLTISTIKKTIKLGTIRRIGLIIGSDIIRELHLWHRIEELLSIVTLLIFPRSGYYKTSHFLVKDICTLIDSGVLEYHLFPPREMLSISSYDIRMSEKMEIYKKNIPALVYKYIQENNLYCTL